VLGCRIHSAQQILADHQQLEVGDVIRLTKKGGPSYRVERAEPPNLLVLVSASPAPCRLPGREHDRPTGPHRRTEGEGRKRLISRLLRSARG
jgi:hypothetical protein